jgi:methyltransferase (TIGR00027 family)
MGRWAGSQLPCRRDDVRVVELDSAHTQRAKADLYGKNNIVIPRNARLVPVDFEKEKLSEKLEAGGVKRGERTLFIIEGVTMYLDPSAVDRMFSEITGYAGKGSIVVFDYIHRDVLGRGKGRYGGRGALRAAAAAGESFQSGLDKGSIRGYASRFGLEVVDHLDDKEMEKRFFTDERGNIVHPINGIHCLVAARQVR